MQVLLHCKISMDTHPCIDNFHPQSSLLFNAIFIFKIVFIFKEVFISKIDFVVKIVFVFKEVFVSQIDFLVKIVFVFKIAVEVVVLVATWLEEQNKLLQVLRSATKSSYYLF